MKFKDKQTNIVLETENDFIIEMYKKDAERFEIVKETKARKPKTEQAEN